MAQLTDDCFAFSGPLLPLSEMERLIADRIAPVGETETVPLRGARGRITAHDIVAPVDLPPFDNSAVDGYAVRHGDLEADGDTELAVVGRLTAGARAELSCGPKQAIRIFTGAMMPKGADTVFMQEDVTVDGDRVIVPKGLALGANRRLAGEDVPKGKVVLPAGTVLEAQHIALLAALGITDIAVRRRLKVAIFSTGDEVVEPGAARGGAAIFDANRYLLTALLERLGAVVTDLGILADDPSELARALAKAAAWHDLIITSGGVSTGEADYVRGAVEKIGSLTFWRVAIKPGRPVAMGVIRAAPRKDYAANSGAAFCGLPGNPVAVFVTFVRVVKPLLLRLGGARPQTLTPLPVRAAFAYKKKKDRREYVRVALRHGADGEVEAVKHPQDGAGILTSLTETDGLLEFPEDVTAIKPGDRVGFLSYAALMG
ncbi:MAG: molybdopterin molybdenumtransferase MoeA [Rhodopseudomonas sp.]|nr:molybdopterin molybdenumtransferase MoeA [Rhodopseudomonas sp.]